MEYMHQSFLEVLTPWTSVRPVFKSSSYPRFFLFISKVFLPAVYWLILASILAFFSLYWLFLVTIVGLIMNSNP